MISADNASDATSSAVDVRVLEAVRQAVSDDQIQSEVIETIRSSGIVSKATIDVLTKLRQDGKVQPGVYRVLVQLHEDMMHPILDLPEEPVKETKKRAVKEKKESVGKGRSKKARPEDTQLDLPEEEALPPKSMNTWRPGSRGYVIMELLLDGLPHDDEEIASVCAAAGKPVTPTAMALVVAEIRRDHTDLWFRYDYEYNDATHAHTLRCVPTR